MVVEMNNYWNFRDLKRLQNILEVFPNGLKLTWAWFLIKLVLGMNVLKDLPEILGFKHMINLKNVLVI